MWVWDQCCGQKPEGGFAGWLIENRVAPTTENSEKPWRGLKNLHESCGYCTAQWERPLLLEKATKGIRPCRGPAGPNEREQVCRKRLKENTL